MVFDLVFYFELVLTCGVIYYYILYIILLLYYYYIISYTILSSSSIPLLPNPLPNLSFKVYVSRVPYSYLYSFQDLGLEMCIGCCYSRYDVWSWIVLRCWNPV